MFNFVQLVWYYPSFFLLMYISLITFQKKSYYLILDSSVLQIKKLTQKFLEKLNFL
jgi:hypothetical protein